MRPENIVFSKFFSKPGKEEKAKTALSFMDEEYSFDELEKAIDLCAGDLLKMGVRPGDHVGLWSTNSVNWVVCFFAILRIEATAVLFNYAWKLDEVVKLARKTDIAYFAVGHNAETVANPASVMELIKELDLSIDKIYNISYLSLNFKKRLAGRSAALNYQPSNTDEAESRRTSVIIFTTGTTSEPKAVELSQYALGNTAVIKYQMIIGNIAGREMLVALPLFHSYGLFVCLGYLFAGRGVVLIENLSGANMLKAIEKRKISDVASVSVLYSQLLAQPEFGRIAAPSVNICLVGGGFTTPTHMIKMETAFDHARFINGYGQTEAGPLISAARAEDSLEIRATTLGKSDKFSEIRIWDSKKGFLEKTEIGEVVMKGYNLMNGYYKMPKEDQAIDENGWLHTGDLGYINEDGDLCLSGRCKDIIIRKGENISPLDVEKELLSIPGVLEAKVMGAPHPLYGESVEACICVMDPAEFSEEELRKKLFKRMEAFKVPSDIFFYESFPHNSNGKIDQKSLRADMLTRLRKVTLAKELKEGVELISLRIKNTSYNVGPVTALLETLSLNVGFPVRKTKKIALSVEEFLTERIINAFSDVGNIQVSATLFEDVMRITFEDEGLPYSIEKNLAESISAKIIFQVVDVYRTVQEDNKKHKYIFEYEYEKDFDINEFLINHDRKKTEE